VELRGHRRLELEFSGVGLKPKFDTLLDVNEFLHHNSGDARGSTQQMKIYEDLQEHTLKNDLELVAVFLVFLVCFSSFLFFTLSGCFASPPLVT